ncbi:hypothetical protein SCHIN_v1c01410 [Spiroplasma chinense]|uniref:RDD domain-containing protein n=1 Tax=Spiroplasma chinense TaxID=216932 RepID=A0A5B9Y3T5_9MOLU|nr:RDD family protein [Spiroplasma chinense]QEH61339.1 hypothetical protein SCHIN_v1c01410 [Spiroplasma chinense]
MSKLNTQENFDNISNSLQEWNKPHLGRVFFARLFDTILASIPMIILIALYRASNWQSALIITSVNLTTLFLCFVLLPYFLKGNTLGKLMLNLRLVKKDDSKVTFWNILAREIYYVFIPVFIQLISQILIIVIFVKLNSDNSDELKGKEPLTLLQNLSYLLYTCWYLYICLTIALQKENQSSIDHKMKLWVRHVVKIDANLVKVKEEKPHVHLKENRPGLIDIEQIDELFEDE